MCIIDVNLIKLCLPERKCAHFNITFEYEQHIQVKTHIEIKDPFNCFENGFNTFDKPFNLFE